MKWLLNSIISPIYQLFRTEYLFHSLSLSLSIQLFKCSPWLEWQSKGKARLRSTPSRCERETAPPLWDQMLTLLSACCRSKTNIKTTYETVKHFLLWSKSVRGMYQLCYATITSTTGHKPNKCTTKKNLILSFLCYLFGFTLKCLLVELSVLVNSHCESARLFADCGLSYQCAMWWIFQYSSGKHGLAFL